MLIKLVWTFSIFSCYTEAQSTFSPRYWNHLGTARFRVYWRSSGCLNGFSVGWHYSGCVQPLFWSGNVVSVGIWPDHTHNTYWEEGRFALLQPELSPLCSVCISKWFGDWLRKAMHAEMERNIETKACPLLRALNWLLISPCLVLHFLLIFLLHLLFL